MIKKEKNNYDYTDLGLKLVNQMAQLTFDRVGQKSIDNINHNQENLKYGQSIVKLKESLYKISLCLPSLIRLSNFGINKIINHCKPLEYNSIPY